MNSNPTLLPDSISPSGGSESSALPRFFGDDLPQIVCIQSVLSQLKEHGLEKLARAFVPG
jgi:hypothetical protein